jgi:hypothetical protein
MKERRFRAKSEQDARTTFNTKAKREKRKAKREKQKAKSKKRKARVLS